MSEEARLIYDMAKKYRKISWNVIPLFNFSKNPAPLPWKEYQDRLSTNEEFENWFNTSGVTGLGLITGRISGVVVLDEDTYKEGGIRVKVDTGMLAKTARDGKHHYFRYVEPIKSSGFKKGVNIEIKADGGFVVLPPSEVIIDGVKGKYEWISKCYPQDLMEILEEQLTPYRGEKTQSINVEELRFASLGSQHNSLRSIALSVFARFKQEEWRLAEEIIIAEAAKFDPPHPEARVLKLIKDTKKFIITHNRQDVEDEIQREPVLPSTINDLVTERIADRDLEKQAPKTGWPELDNLIKGFIPGHIYTLTGNTNVGKTTIACNFAEALRKQGKKTLYIALEPGVNLVEYLASIRHNKPFDQVTDEELFLETEDRLIQVFLQQDVQSVDDLIHALKGISGRFDLIIIDHIGYFVRTEKDWLQQQSNVIKQLAFLAKTNKTAVMMIAHLRKPNITKKNQDWVPTQDDISGSGAFKQDSTEVLIAYRPTKQEDKFAIEFTDHGYLLVTKTKVGPNGSCQLLFAQRSAKIWSMEEAQATPQGQVFLQQKHHGEYQSAMQASALWMEKEVDTGNND